LNKSKNLLPYVTSLRNDGNDGNDGSIDGESAELHRFIASPAGVLVHYTDNQLRAIVPPQGFDDYLVAWPESAAAIVELRRARAQIESTANAAIAKAMTSSKLHRQ